jgi:hypothetical protein
MRRHIPHIILITTAALFGAGYLVRNQLGIEFSQESIR